MVFVWLPLPILIPFIYQGRPARRRRKRSQAGQTRYKRAGAIY